MDKLKACGKIGYVSISLQPHDISCKMLQRTPYSLNAMSHDTAINLVRRALDLGVRVTKCYVDTVGDPGYYQSKLSKAFAHQIDFTVSKKADSLYKTVSAASICAKVTRDRQLKYWVFREPAFEAVAARAAAGADSVAAVVSESGDAAAYSDLSEGDEDEAEGGGAGSRPTKRLRGSGEIEGGGDSVADKVHPRYGGSGYPGDPLTKKWLRAHIDPVFGWPDVVRFSWSTCKELLESSCKPVTWEEDATEEGAMPQSKLSSFFGKGARKGPPRYKYFAVRNMEHVVTL